MLIPFCFSSQLPGQVTFVQSKNLIPVEIMGWLLHHLFMAVAVPRILVASGDPQCLLACSLLARLDINVNVVLGLTEVGQHDGEVKQMTDLCEEVIKPTCRQLDTMVPIVWAQGTSCN